MTDIPDSYSKLLERIYHDYKLNIDSLTRLEAHFRDYHRTSGVVRDDVVIRGIEKIANLNNQMNKQLDIILQTIDKLP